MIRFSEYLRRVTALMWAALLPALALAAPPLPPPGMARPKPRGRF